eukprot:TRINITY_DN6393_c0_g2_i1.p1 TRINITY_DN6393_c0_g2~~TRINITY_DN6393_c0_g2_i1.p1  ORF type:complete len:678 (+),score=144.31 TRINITY_DN6393_c0_g2_i1:242-2035(+)
MAEAQLDLLSKYAFMNCLPVNESDNITDSLLFSEAESQYWIQGNVILSIKVGKLGWAAVRARRCSGTVEWIIKLQNKVRSFGKQAEKSSRDYAEIMRKKLVFKDVISSPASDTFEESDILSSSADDFFPAKLEREESLVSVLAYIDSEKNYTPEGEENITTRYPLMLVESFEDYSETISSVSLRDQLYLHSPESSSDHLFARSNPPHRTEIIDRYSSDEIVNGDIKLSSITSSFSPCDTPKDERKYTENKRYSGERFEGLNEENQENYIDDAHEYGSSVPRSSFSFSQIFEGSQIEKTITPPTLKNPSTKTLSTGSKRRHTTEGPIEFVSTFKKNIIPPNSLPEVEEYEIDSYNMHPSFLFLQMHKIPFVQNTPPIKVKNSSYFKKKISDLDSVLCQELFTFGVVYIGENQMSDREVILRNTSGSAKYSSFLRELGDFVFLKDKQPGQYDGGLHLEDGDYSICWKDEITQVMFHITTMMNNIDNKNFHIDKNNVLIVYNDDNVQYNPMLFENGVIIVIKPLGKHYCIEIISEEELHFSEIIQNYIVRPEDLGRVVVQCAIVADVAMKRIKYSQGVKYSTQCSKRLEKLLKIRKMFVK